MPWPTAVLLGQCIYKLKGNLIILLDNNGTLQERITNVKNKRDFEI